MPAAWCACTNKAVTPGARRVPANRRGDDPARHDPGRDDPEVPAQLIAAGPAIDNVDCLVTSLLFDCRERQRRLRHQGFAPAGWIQIALPPPETMWMSSTVVRSTGRLLKVMWVALMPASGASA